MTGPIVIFLGPTLSADAARARLDGLYLPPCRMGDVFRAVDAHHPRAIGIVDGYFEATPAVWHKEILYALSRGVPVFGASSMGALRAAELHPFGMEGVGSIFTAFASGEMTDDDEVAVVHANDSSGYAAASVPMVNLRHGLSLATTAGVIDAKEEGRVIAALKELHYPRRSWQAVWNGAGDLPADRIAALREFVEATDCDLKAKDARAMLDRIAEWDANGAAAPETHGFDFEPTLFWEELMRLNRGGDNAVDEQNLLDHLRIAEPARDDILRDALLHHLVEEAAARLEIEIPDDRTVLARFRRIRGQTTPALLKEWMAEQKTDQAACLELARHEARLRALLQRTMPSLSSDLTATLRLRGEYRRVTQRAAHIAADLSCKGIADPGPEHVESLAPVLARYQRNIGAIHTELETHAAELGFGSMRHFLRTLIGVHLASTSEEAEDGTSTRQHA